MMTFSLRVWARYSNRKMTSLTIEGESERSSLWKSKIHAGVPRVGGLGMDRLPYCAVGSIVQYKIIVALLRTENLCNLLFF